MRMNGKILTLPVMLALVSVVVIGSGALGPAFPLSCLDAVAASTLKGDSLKGKVISTNGKPISGAQVQLLSPAKTMMDVTTSGSDGKFTIDLGVLEDEEMERLTEFSLVVSKKGKKVKKVLDTGATSSNGIVSVEAIEFP
jgi:hypothetical protein